VRDARELPWFSRFRHRSPPSAHRRILLASSPSSLATPLGGGVEPRWPPELVGSSPLVRRAREQVREAAATGRALVVAEGGLDPEAVARAIHQCAASRPAPFIVVDCGGRDAAGVEATLFGTPIGRGTRRSDGPVAVGTNARILEAAGGTLYVAGVADLPASAQAHLARIVRDGEVRVAGSAKRVRLEARVVAGAGPTIDAEVAQGGFRLDLYRRLAAVRIEVPPLRLRSEDLPAVVRVIADEVSARARTPRALTKAALAFLAALPWPGNVGELRDVLQRAMAAAPSELVRVEDLLAELGGAWRLPATGPSLREARRQFEREYIAAVLREHGWRMSEAARVLGMQRTNLYRKVRQLDLLGPRLRRK